MSTPFPMVFGDVLDSSIKKVTIEVKGNDNCKYIAKLIGVERERMIWFAFLPPDPTPFDIKGFNEKGDLLVYKTVTDPRDSGSIQVNSDSWLGTPFDNSPSSNSKSRVDVAPIAHPIFRGG